MVGKLFVSNKKIADGRKGYLYHCKNNETENEIDINNDETENETGILYASNAHPNIIRFHGFERQEDFMYLCLERWKYS